MSKQISKPDMAETQHSQPNLEEINKIMTHQMLDLLKDKLTELKGDTDPQIFQHLSYPNSFIGRGFRYQSYETIMKRIITFFRENCTPEWYPNNAVEQPLDVSGYSGSIGNLNLKTELMNVFASTSVKDNLTAKHKALQNYLENGEGDLFPHDLVGFGVAKFRKWMKTNDLNHAPPTPTKKVILSFIKDMRNPKNKDEEEYKQGRVTAMCFALLLTEELTKAGQREQEGSYIKILGAAMIHALTTHENSSQPLWEHICDVIYPPEQHKEETILFHYVATCTMGDHHYNFSVCDGFYRYMCSCPSGCRCNQMYVDAEDSLRFFLNNNSTKSVREWESKMKSKKEGEER